LLLLVSSPSRIFAHQFNHAQIPLYDNTIDISGAKFRGLSTYASLPYVHCLSAGGDEEVEDYDIAILGAPFDTVSMKFANVIGRKVCSDRWICSLLREDLVPGLDRQVFDEGHRGYRMDIASTQVCLLPITPLFKKI
jgi:hypothetical protein